MTVVLLVISGLPLVSMAETCPMPAHTSFEAAADIELLAEPASHEISTGHHDALSSDMQDCRIECACGCHQSIDTLPHQLAPHVFSEHEDACVDVTSLQISNYAPFSFELIAPIELPPPDLG